MKMSQIYKWKEFPPKVKDKSQNQSRLLFTIHEFLIFIIFFHPQLQINYLI